MIKINGENLDMNVVGADVTIHTKLTDKDDGLNHMHVGIECKNGAICIGAFGYGENSAARGHGTPIMIELYEGRWRVVAWDDINKADPKIIDMEGAREHKRVPEPA